jgi:hypothetical protein
MLGRPGLLDAGRNVIDPLAGHLAALFLKPTHEAIAMDKDDVLTLDVARVKVIPEDHHGLYAANVSLLHDGLSQPGCAPTHTCLLTIARRRSPRRRRAFVRGPHASSLAAPEQHVNQADRKTVAGA